MTDSKLMLHLVTYQLSITITTKNMPDSGRILDHHALPCLMDARWQRVRWRTICWPSKGTAHQLLCPCVFSSFLFFFDSYYGVAVAQAMLQGGIRSTEHQPLRWSSTWARSYSPYSSRRNNDSQRRDSANLKERTGSRLSEAARHLASILLSHSSATLPY